MDASNKSSNWNQKTGAAQTHGKGGGRPVVAIVLALGCAAAVPLQATAEELKWHHSHHVIKTEVVEVGDVPGHILAVSKASRLGFFDGGVVATLTLSTVADYRNGAGDTEGYVWYTFEDGSSYFIKYESVATPDPAGKGTMFNGKFSFTAGTGRFNGIQGSGSFSGKRLSPLGAGAEVYAVFTGNYSR